MEWFLHTWLPILGLVVSAGTLLVVIIYTAITARIERAAQEQAEASQKPVIVLQCHSDRSSSEIVLEQMQQMKTPTSPTYPQAMRLSENVEGKFVIKNIGSGPALNVSYAFHDASRAPDPGDPNCYARKLPYLGPDDSLSGASVTSDGDRSTKFTATYESLSGKRYRTEMHFAVRTRHGVLLEDWIFTPLKPSE